MHLLFLDEAGSAGERELILGGVAVPIDCWSDFRAGWISEVPTAPEGVDREVKWHKVKNAKRPSRLIKVLADCGVTAFAVELYVEWGRKVSPELFATHDDTYATALMFIAERFQKFLVRRDSHGAIVIDHRNLTDDNKLRRFFQRLAQLGTPYMELDRLVDPILLSPSHLTIGIQAADLVVGPMYALARSDGNGPSAPRRQLARDLHDLTLPLFDCHPSTGEVEGVGIKRFPDVDRGLGRKLFDLRTVEV